MARKIIPLYMLALSFLSGNDLIFVKLENGEELQGVFIGTYMDHVHVLVGEELFYYSCGDIRSILSEPGKEFDYDCGENTVTADILFPPELDPMTGEWASRLPDVFNPEILKPVERTKADYASNKDKLEKQGFSPNKIESIIDHAMIRVESENAVDDNVEMINPYGIVPITKVDNIDSPSKNEVSTFWIDNEEKTPESQQILKKEEIVEKDFIMINGVKYVRAEPDGDIDQDNLPKTTKEKTRKNKREKQISDRYIREMAIQDAERRHDKLTWGLVGLGSFGTSLLGAVIGVGLTDNFLGFIFGGVAGLALPYGIANNYDASNSLLYPRKIKTSKDKELYKKTYLKEAQKLAKESVKKAPMNAIYCGFAFFALIIMA